MKSINPDLEQILFYCLEKEKHVTFKNCRNCKEQKSYCWNYFKNCITKELEKYGKVDYINLKKQFAILEMKYINLSELQIELISAIADMSQKEVQAIEEDGKKIVLNFENLKTKKDNIITFKKKENK